MSDWEDVPISKVNEQNIGSFMDLKDGLAGAPENPVSNLKQIDEELARPNLHPVAKKALTEERLKLSSAASNMKWEDAPKAKAGGQWEDVPATSNFKSGSAFEDTGAMLPSLSDMGDFYSHFGDRMKDIKDSFTESRAETAKIREIKNKSAASRTAAENRTLADYTKKFTEGNQRMMADEHAAGSGALDIIGGIPAMIAGAGHGVYEGVSEWDATKGLNQAGKTMTKFLPSTLLGNEADQQSEGYKAAMAPITAAMDTLNAIPQGYGEMLHMAGADKAAAQVTDAGKLGIMVGMGAMGAKGLMGKGKGKAKVTPEETTAGKLEALLKQIDEEAKAVEQPAEPVAPDTTVAHADDFAAINPYDVAGHVTEAREGRPSTIDNAQGDLFGGESLQEAQRAPDMGQESIRHDTIPYEKTSPFELEPKSDGPAPLATMGKQLNEFQPREQQQTLSLEPKEEPLPTNMNQARAYPDALAENRAKMEAPEPLNNPAMQEAMIAATRDQAHMDAERVAKEQKDAHYQQLEDLAVAERAGELDYQHTRDVIKDKSLMGQQHTIAMRGLLRMGDIKGALETIKQNHPSAGYRELAGYLQGKLEGVKVTMHDTPTVKLGQRDTTGYYNADTNTVGLSGLGATSPHTVLHEMAHAVTSRFINDRPLDMRVKALGRMFDAMRKDGTMAKQFPGIINGKEFVAEAFSNPRFQEYLKGRNYESRSLWNRFVDSVKGMLGVKGEGQLATALDHAIDLSKQIVDAQTGKARALDQFKAAGVPKALADLMAQTPHDMPTSLKQEGGMEKMTKKIPGLTTAVSDFAFFDKPVEEIVQMAKDSPDIPNTMVEKFAQQMQAGALFESLKTRNPVVKYTYERITRAFQEASHAVKVNLTNGETGLKKYMRDLTPTEKGEVHSAMMLVEGQRELTMQDLATAGFNEKQIAYAMRYREISDKFFNDINERRKALGMEPMDKRVSHIAGRFMGDFARMVYHDGKVVGRIAGSTRAELAKVTKYMEEQHPEWHFDKEEYNRIGHGRDVKDRFAGMMEAINFIEKSDSNAKALMDSYKGYLQQDAVNYLNATRHAKDKVKQAGGVVGSEGNKPWNSAVKNAEEGMKSQLAYFEQGYQWMAMEKATRDLKQVLGNEDVVKQTPNAVEYADKYVKHSMGRDQGKISDALNGLLSNVGELSGLGHTNIMKVNSMVKHRIMQKFMGLGNIPFSLTQLMQPLQTQPAMIRLMRSRGLEFSTAEAQAKAANTYLHSMLEEAGAAKMTPFERDAVAYADQMSIFDVKMADHTKDINVSKGVEAFDRLADLNITAPEHLTRGMTFLFYSHMLKDAGIPMKDIFGAAENMTNMSMVNYHQIERPMGYAKLGWLGDVASTLSRYKHNQWSQLAFYGREGIRGEHGAVKSMAPLTTFLGTSLLFGGAMGFFAYNEADSAYQMFSEHVMKKPDSLTNQLLQSHLPEVVTHGIFSQLGLDMTTRFSNANAIPDSIGAAMMPYGSAVMDIMDSTGRYAMDPTNSFKAKQMGKAIAPQSIQGVLENSWFTRKGENGKPDMYFSSTEGPNKGKGRVERSEGDKTLRAFGFRNVRESKELAQNYANSQAEKGHKNIAQGQVDKVIDDVLANRLTPERFKQYAQKAAAHGMDPNAFSSKIVSWTMATKLTQKEQQQLRQAQGGFTGAFNFKDQQR